MKREHPSTLHQGITEEGGMSFHTALGILLPKALNHKGPQGRLLLLHAYFLAWYWAHGS